MLIQLSQARRAIDRVRVRAPPVRRVPVTAAVGRLAATTLLAPRNLPVAALSAMDGYALRLEAENGGGLFTLQAAVRSSGRQRGPALRPGEASYITTGTPLPPGANAVVRVEAARREGGRLRVLGEIRPGQDILPPGEAMARGDVIVTSGEPVKPAHVAALVGQGFRTVPVFDPTVTIVPIGDGLVPATAPRGSAARDFIGPTIVSLLGFANVQLRAPVGPDRATVARTLLRASRRSDLVVTTGGSSMGERDITKAAVNEVGRIWFEGVTANVLKRGAVGDVAGTPVLILPGQLVSAVAAYHEHGLHLLGRMVGRELRVVERVTLGADLEVHHRMDSLYLFRLSDGIATPLPWGVARMTALLQADAFGILRRGRHYRPGDRIEVQRLSVVR